MQPSEGYQGLMCNIETKENKKVHISQRRVPQAMQKGTKEIVTKMLNDGVTEISLLSWCNPTKTAMKPNGEIRLRACSIFCICKNFPNVFK
jgi:hypothetical protein